MLLCMMFGLNKNMFAQLQITENKVTNFQPTKSVSAKFQPLTKGGMLNS